MNDSTTDKVKGKLHEVEGSWKEKAGRVANDPELEERGTEEKVAGKIQKKVGDIEKVIDK